MPMIATLKFDEFLAFCIAAQHEWRSYASVPELKPTFYRWDDLTYSSAILVSISVGAPKEVMACSILMP